MKPSSSSGSMQSFNTVSTSASLRRSPVETRNVNRSKFMFQVTSHSIQEIIENINYSSFRICSLLFALQNGTHLISFLQVEEQRIIVKKYTRSNGFLKILSSNKYG